MYNRGSNRGSNRSFVNNNRRQSNNVSFHDPLTISNSQFGSNDMNANQYNRLQQLIRQQSPSSHSNTISSASSIPQLPHYHLSQQVHLLMQQRILHQQQQQQQAALQQQLLHHQQQQYLQHHHHHHSSSSSSRHQSSSRRHYSSSTSSRQHRLNIEHQIWLREALKSKEREQEKEEEKYNQLNIMDFESLTIKNKATNTINWNEWENRMESVEINDDDTNKLILDYLICCGDYEIAKEFTKESNTEIMKQQKENMDEWKLRASIKNAINNGKMIESIKLLNEFDDRFLDKYPEILLEIQKQQLIELIHDEKIGEAFQWNVKHLLPKTKLNGIKNDKEKEKRKKLLIELGDIMSLIACRNVKNIPKKQRNLLSLDKRHNLADKINRILLKNENKQRIGGESLLFENISQINYYQDFLMNLGIKEQFEKGKISSKSLIMSYNEENINSVKARHPEFGKDNKHKTSNDRINGIENWVKLHDKYRLKIKNYLPFSFDTSKCQRFKLKKLSKYNTIHVCDKL